MSGRSESFPERPQQIPHHTLAEMAAHLGVPMPEDADGAALVTGVALDSRRVRRGDVYAALDGARVHGAHFAATARAAGAVAGVTDRRGEALLRAAGLPAYVVDIPRQVLGPLSSWVYGDPSARLRLVGVTGTNGKTTTAYLVEAGLRAAGMVTGLIGTIETRVGDEQVPSVRTTPEAPELQAMLAVMRERAVEAVVMEVSSHALAMNRVDGTSYDVGIFTNLTPEHLDFHHDLESYFAAKARLFTPGFLRCGVVNVGDSYGMRLAREAQVPVVAVGNGGHVEAAWHIAGRTATSAGTRFRLSGPQGRVVEALTRLPGMFNVDNAALAIVALTELGVDVEVAAEGVASVADVPGRMQRIDVGQPFGAIVDYAHSPDALERLLTTARELTTGRVIVVFGCGGDRDASKRPVMGEIAARESDVAVLTSDNPRGEDPDDILAAILEGTTGATGAARIEVVPDRRRAIEHAVALAAPGDLVVVAGKGHEQGQEIDGTVHPFDDRDVLRSAIASLT